MTEQLAQLIDFPLLRHADLTHMSRRVRLLAALTELPQRQRADLSRCVTEVCRHVLSNGSRGNVEFSVVTHERHHFLEVAIRDDGPPTVPVKNGLPVGTAETGTVKAEQPDDQQEPLRHLRDVIDQFRFEGEPGPGSVARLRQMLPPTFQPPTPAETALWRGMVQQKSLEDAILVFSRRARRLESGEDARRDRHSLHGEMPHTTEEAESLFALIASETDNFVVVMDGQGNIIWVNAAFVRMTGYSAAGINRRRLDELLGGPESDKSILRDFREALRQGHRFNDELLLYRKDHAAYWTHFTLTPVRTGAGTGVQRWIAIGTDVTRQRQTIEALAASRKAAENASRAKSEFLANVSHEIRTPLNAIIGMTDLTLGTRLTPEQLEYLTTVKLSGESLLELLNDVLDLSRIEAGKLTIEHVDFDLARLLRDTVRALAVRAESKGVQLKCHLPADLPLWLHGDSVRLRQILVNLIGNAVKFTHAGEIVVSVEPQWRTDDEVGLHFCVSDTGIGIARDKLHRIFEAFEQGDTSTTREYGGTGLGLTITSELLRLMGGRVQVESRVGHGSRFHFSLSFPLVENPPDDKHTETDRPESSGSTTIDADNPPVRPLRVLVADDHEANRHLVTMILQKRGHRCESAVNGKDALARFNQADPPFDVVLMDIQMPDMDGVEATSEIRQRERIRGTHTPIIALTAHAMKGDREKCLSAGMDNYLAKPLRPASLISVVEQAGGARRPGHSEPDPPQHGTAAPAHIDSTNIDSTNIEFAFALERLDGDEDLLRSQMHFFLNDGPALIGAIRDGIDVGDAEVIRRAAHRLKGLLAGYGRQSSSQLASQLEHTPLGTPQDAKELCNQLDHAVQALAENIRLYLKRS